MFAPDSRILVVDDVGHMRVEAIDVLTKCGFKKIHQAPHGKLALEKILEHQKTSLAFDLVLCDWHMPVMDGVELIKKIRAVPELKELPFILLTSESEAIKVMEAIVAGVSSYIVKPMTVLTLKEKLQLVWDKHNPKTPK